MKTITLILAAGSGVRMGSKTPKQYLHLFGKRLLYYSINAFQENKNIEKIYIAVNKKLLEEYNNGQDNYLSNLLFTLRNKNTVEFIEGGDTRQETVRKSLEYITKSFKDKEDLQKYNIIIHDGDRPLITSKNIDNLINSFKNCDAVAPVINLTEDIINIQNNIIPNRTNLKSLQTPMIFNLHYIWFAHNYAFKNNLKATEELQLLQKLNSKIRIKLIEGSFNYFKIIYPQDIKIIEKLFEYKEEEDTIVEVEEAIEELNSGKGIIVSDSEDRENEGDLMFLSDKISPENMNMLTFCRGIICFSITPEKAKQIKLTKMIENKDISVPAFTQTIDHVSCGSGTSVFDRSLTILKAMQNDTKSKDFRKPGHVNPLIAHKDGLSGRLGHTEATVTLAKACGANPSSVICEILNDDGSMARMPQLKSFARLHGLKITTIDKIIEYAKKHNIKY